MIISFDRKCRKKAIGTVSVPSRDVNQILDDIEEEMSRLYSEVCDHYAKQKKDFRKSLFRKRNGHISLLIVGDIRMCTVGAGARR